jgi:hypothetical protein
MPKRLLLVAEEGTALELDKSLEAVNYVLKNRYPTLIFKTFAYDPDYPEELTYHLGQTMKFMSNGRFIPNGSPNRDEELPTEEEKGIRAMMGQFWKASKPTLREFGKEVWYSKQQLKEIRAKEQAEKQRILDQSNGPVEETKKVESSKT